MLVRHAPLLALLAAAALCAGVRAEETTPARFDHPGGKGHLGKNTEGGKHPQSPAERTGSLAASFWKAPRLAGAQPASWACLSCDLRLSYAGVRLACAQGSRCARMARGRSTIRLPLRS